MKLKYLIPIIGIYLAWLDYDSIQINGNGDLERKTDLVFVLFSAVVTLVFLTIVF